MEAEEKQQPGKKTGRISELERRPELQEQLCALLASGNRIETACLMVGISPNTFHEWMARGEDRDPERPPQPIFANFANAIKRAMGYATASRVQRIEKAGKGGDIASVTRYFDKEGNVVSEKKTFTPPQWQADAWLLERSQPEAWGRRLALDAKIQNMSNEELENFILEGILVDEDEVDEVEDTAESGGSELALSDGVTVKEDFE